MVLSGGPVARAHTVAAPVFAASSRLPASLSMVSVTASRRWMSSAPEDPTHGAAPVDQAAAEPYRPVGDFAGMEAIPVYDPVGAQPPPGAQPSPRCNPYPDGTAGLTSAVLDFAS